MSTRQITVPTIAEIRAAASTLNIDLSDAEVEMFGAFMEPMTGDYQLVEEMEAPKLPVNYPRDKGYRPNADENTHNAWYWKSTIKGAPSGKLVGKKLVIKDNISVAGLPMMNGSRIWDGFMPEEDATVVTRILDAGGEILGKAVCEDLCFSGGSHTSATGPVRNPHKPEFMSGGSSSGCAALIVAGECDMGVGSDQGGSVRMPSSFSGCYGIKPSYGLVPYTGAMGIEQSCDHLGPMAATSEDCALLLEVLAGFDDGLDTRQNNMAPVKNYTKALTGDVKGLKIGVVKEGFGTPNAEADVDSMVRQAAERFTELGAEVAEVSIPMHQQAASIMFVSILEGTLVTAKELNSVGTIAKGHFQLDVIRYYEEVCKNRLNDLPVTVKNVLLFALTMRNRYGNYYSAKAQNLVRNVRAAYDKTLESCDLLIMPTTPMKALRIPPPDAPQEVIMASALPMIGNTAPFDSSGHPSMSVPAGMSDGLPVGMMITGRFGEDDVVLRAGHAFEQLG